MHCVFCVLSRLSQVTFFTTALNHCALIENLFLLIVSKVFIIIGVKPLLKDPEKNRNVLRSGHHVTTCDLFVF